MTEQLLEAQTTDSTVIDEDIDGVKSGGGKPAVEPVEKKEPAPRKPETARDSLEAEAKKLEAKGKDDDEDGEDEKPEVAEKKEAPKDKPVAKESVKADETGQETKTPKPSEGRKIIEAPARLLPQNKELWKGVAHPIREEWVRREQEYEQEVSQLREHKAFREELKDFEELAKRHNVPFKQALNNYVDIERKFSEDPAMGMRQLCQNLGMTPPQAIGHILRSANVTPQQLIEHIQREPHAYTGLAPQQRTQVQHPSQQPAPDPEIQALKQQVESMRAEQVANAVIVPFGKDYPEYYEHEDAIAKVLESGIIEQIHGQGLSPRDKLEVALLMVAPQAKRASQQYDGDNDSVRGDNRSDNTAPAGDLRGGKSVKSSVGSVSDASEPDRKMSMRDMLEEEARKLSRRA